MDNKTKQFDDFVNSKLNVEVKDDVRTDEKSSATTAERSS